MLEHRIKQLKKKLFTEKEKKTKTAELKESKNKFERFKERFDSGATSMLSEDVVSQTIASRKVIYGDPFLSHQAIGLVWEGLLRNRYHDLFERVPVGTLVPAGLVSEMLAGFKLARLVRPVYHEDSNVDAHAYLRFSKEFRDPTLR